jgi:hypothetical protein
MPRSGNEFRSLQADYVNVDSLHPVLDFGYTTSQSIPAKFILVGDDAFVVLALTGADTPGRLPRNWIKTRPAREDRPEARS